MVSSLPLLALLAFRRRLLRCCVGLGVLPFQDFRLPGGLEVEVAEKLVILTPAKCCSGERPDELLHLEGPHLELLHTPCCENPVHRLLDRACRVPVAHTRQGRDVELCGVHEHAMHFHELLPENDTAAVLWIADPHLLIKRGRELLEVHKLVVRLGRATDEQDSVLLCGFWTPFNHLDGLAQIFLDTNRRVRVRFLSFLLCLEDLVHLVDVDHRWSHVLCNNERLVHEQG
mmetsp:Transcript_53887/g.136105  ORF Transcript_53887/g.136105 Transcript_53887/m.136105 type:complete len:230 (-) Transcript_53887:2024-2713(-)